MLRDFKDLGVSQEFLNRLFPLDLWSVEGVIERNVDCIDMFKVLVKVSGRPFRMWNGF